MRLLADLFELAVFHLDSSMVLDLLSDVPVPSDGGILSCEVLTLLNQTFQVESGFLNYNTCVPLIA